MERFGQYEVTAWGSEYAPADSDLPVVTFGYFALTLC